MTVAENAETLPLPRGGNYETARFNALQHGVLSQYTVLPWEDGAEYSALIEALAAEHSPEGPTEEHLVEEQDLADLDADQTMTEVAMRLLRMPSPTAYVRAVAALREDTREW